jgi:hypothetical protein
MLRLRMFAIAAGYEDADDCDVLRHDPMFKMALGRTPETGDPLCSQPTMSRLENAPPKIEIARLMEAMVDQFCASYQHRPRSIVLDIDDTFDAVHGGQQLRLFNAHYDEYGFQPIVVFDGEGRFVTAVLRPAKRPSGKEIKPFLRRLVRAIRAHWPRTEILLRADSHYCGPEVLDWCRANGLDYVLGVAPTPRPGRASSAASRSSSTARKVGAASSGSSLASKSARKDPTRASSSPTYKSATPARCTKTSTAGAAAPKTTSSPSRRIWRRIAPPAPRPPPISFGCSCTPAPTG